MLLSSFPNTFFFSIYEIYCHIGFHTTPSAHPKRCPPQCPSPTHNSLPPPPHQPTIYSQFLRVSYGLALSLSNFFIPLPLPAGLLLSFSGSTYEWKHTVSVFLWLTIFTKHSTLQFHPRCCKWPDFITSHCHVVFHYVYKLQFLYPFISWWTFRLFP